MLSAIVAPLAAGELPVWVASTFDGDLVLVPATLLNEAIDMLRRACHDIAEQAKVVFVHRLYARQGSTSETVRRRRPLGEQEPDAYPNPTAAPPDRVEKRTRVRKAIAHRGARSSNQPSAGTAASSGTFRAPPP